MTERLYYHDSYLRDFRARVIERSEGGRTVYLDRTAFYPASGGQPYDLGAIGGAAVAEVVDEGERIGHRLEEPLGVVEGEVDCAIDWERRFDHMQQHTGQHVLSAVLEEMRLSTVSFHLAADYATIDVEGPAIDLRMAAEAERRANAVIYENRGVAVRFEAAAEARGLRKPPEREGTLRIIAIEGLDRSACGGTHVRATGEIGAILVRKLEKIRQATRVEFLCGGRAVRRARADYEALAKAAQLFSAPLDEVPGMLAAELEASRAAERIRKKLELELAGYRGKELYAATEPGADGFRRVLRRLERGNLEEIRALAQNFTAQPKAVFVGAVSEPPSVLLAVSEDAGIDAGKTLRAVLAEAGGRGGGTARIAQGSVGNAPALERVLARV